MATLFNILSTTTRSVTKQTSMHTLNILVERNTTYTFIKIIKNLYTYILTILAEKIQYKYQTIAVFMMFTFISVGHMKISAKDYD